MNHAGEIISGFCIAGMIFIHLVIFFQPFEWQRKAAEEKDYQAFFEQMEIEKRAQEIKLGFTSEADSNSTFPVSGQ